MSSEKSEPDEQFQFASAFPPKPKPFNIGEPFNDRGLWGFWLTADQEIIDFVNHLSCILPASYSPFARRPVNRAVVFINPRYDHEEVWLWLHDLLREETQHVELNDLWEEALENASTNEISEE
jgi:hypothetical protein